MCGIIGCLGYCKCHPHIIAALKQLQNRGYDSAGICTTNGKSYQLYKVASRDNCDSITQLEKKTLNVTHSLGIGHTRWATHGPKTDVNAHPHLDTFNRFALVHNGIIENYLELKHKILQYTRLDKKYSFKSQTDTEVIVNLISLEFFTLLDEFSPSVEKAILSAISQLQGTYALVIIDLLDKNRLYCIRNGSPLLVGITDQLAMVTSEVSGFNNEMVDYHVLDNNNLCILEKVTEGDVPSIKIRTQRNTFETLSVSHESSLNTTPLGEYKYYTQKEIEEQSHSVSRAMCNGGRLLSEHEVKLGGLDRFKKKLVNVSHLIILGCGTSYHAGLVGVNYFKDLCHFKTVQIFDGAEFSERDFPVVSNTEKIGVIFLSQSGETRDLYRCIQFSRRENTYLIGIVNVVDSLIAREVDCGVYLNAGKEVAVASTKAFTSQLVVLMLISMWFSQNQVNNYTKRSRYMKNLHNLSRDVQTTLDISSKIVPTLVKLFKDVHSIFILGKGPGEAIAREGALKIKEIGYIHAEGYSASALKHGPFALLEPGFPVIILALDDPFYEKCINAMEEIKARGATLIVITNSQHKLVLEEPHTIIRLPPGTHCTAEILAVIPLQYLAFTIAIEKGLNPDYPRNLAKVVTVE